MSEAEDYQKPPRYTQFPDYILDHLKDYTPVEFVLLAFICRQTFGFQRNRIKISVSEMVKTTGLGRRTIFRVIESLTRRNILGRVELTEPYEYFLVIKWKVSGIRFIPDATEALVPAGHQLPDATEAPALVPAGHHPINRKTEEKDNTPIVPNGDVAPPEPEKIKNKWDGIKPEQVPIPAKFVTPEFMDVWREFIRYRKTRSKSFTGYAAHLILEKFVSGEYQTASVETAIAMLNQTIERSWTGVFGLSQTSKNENYQRTSGSNPRPTPGQVRNGQITGAESVRKAILHEMANPEPAPWD